MKPRHYTTDAQLAALDPARIDDVEAFRLVAPLAYDVIMESACPDARGAYFRAFYDYREAHRLASWSEAGRRSATRYAQALWAAERLRSESIEFYTRFVKPFTGEA